MRRLYSLLWPPLFRAVAAAMSARMRWIQRRFQSTESVGSTSQRVGSARSAATARNFADPRTGAPSVLALQLERCGYHAPATTIGLLCICDGYRPMPVQSLNQQSTHEHEVWIADARCHVAFRSQDLREVRNYLTRPLPASRTTLSHATLAMFLALAAQVPVEVAVLVPELSDDAPTAGHHTRGRGLATDD